MILLRQAVPVFISFWRASNRRRFRAALPSRLASYLLRHFWAATVRAWLRYLLPGADLCAALLGAARGIPGTFFARRRCYSWKIIKAGWLPHLLAGATTVGMRRARARLHTLYTSYLHLRVCL